MFFEGTGNRYIEGVTKERMMKRGERVRVEEGAVESGMQYSGTFKIEDEYTTYEWEESQRQMEREWYDTEETNQIYTTDASVGLITRLDSTRSTEEKKVPPQKSKSTAENEKWELHQLQTGYRGVLDGMNMGADYVEEEENKLMVIVEDVKPPFLKEDTIFTTQTQSVQVVKDPTSDIAILAKNGSPLLKFLRERNDRSKMRERFWELAGSKLGNILGVNKQENKEAEAEAQVSLKEDGEIDYKAASQYATSINKTTVAVSHFAKTKTIREQREYLPIFEVRNDLLQLILMNKM